MGISEEVKKWEIREVREVEKHMGGVGNKVVPVERTVCTKTSKTL